MIQNLIPYDPHHLKALLARDRVDDHVSVDPNEMLRIEDRVLILPRRVDDLRRKVLIPIAYDFAEGVLDGGVVRVHEMAVDVLDCEGGLACTKTE
jgi:hypothetical protein